MKVRHHHNQISQGDREYAENNWREYGAILGLNHQGEAHGIDRGIVSHLHRPVADEDTPTQEDLRQWTDFGRDALKNGKRLLCYCEAGQNRSAIISALLQAVWERRPYWDVAKEYHDRFLAEDPPHNWWPYKHWQESIDEWLRIHPILVPPQPKEIPTPEPIPEPPTTQPVYPPGPIPIEEALRLAGGQRPDYLVSLYKYVQMLPKPALIVEIGCYRGDSTIMMACGIRGTNSHLVTIDPVFQTGEVWVPDVNLPYMGHYGSSLVGLMNRISQCGLDGYISIIPDYSWNVLARWDGRPIDLLFIDGEHTHEAAKKDTEWMQFVKAGAWAAWDDWMEPIERAVMEYVSVHPEWQLIHKSTDTPTDEWCVSILRKEG